MATSQDLVMKVVPDFTGDMKLVWEVAGVGSAGGKRPCHLCEARKDQFGNVFQPECGFCQTFCTPGRAECGHHDITIGEKHNRNRDSHRTRNPIPRYVQKKTPLDTSASEAAPALPREDEFADTLEPITWFDPSHLYDDNDPELLKIKDDKDSLNAFFRYIGVEFVFLRDTYHTSCVLFVAVC